jgi:hypothetical protein
MAHVENRYEDKVDQNEEHGLPHSFGTGER